MSGVNAHVLVRHATTSSHIDSHQPQGTMQRSRHFISPLPHRLLHSFQPAASLGPITFALDLSHAAVAYLRDHSCGDRSIMPITGWLESVAGATFLLQDQALNTGLSHLITPTCLPLGSSEAGANTHPKVQVTLTPQHGSVVVQTVSGDAQRVHEGAFFKCQICKLGSLRESAAYTQGTSLHELGTAWNAAACKAIMGWQFAKGDVLQPEVATTAMVPELPLSMTDAYHMPPAASAAAAVLPLVGSAAAQDSPLCLSSAARALLTNGQQDKPASSSALITAATATSMRLSRTFSKAADESACIALALAGMRFSAPSGPTAQGREVQESYAAKAPQAIYSISWRAAAPCLGDGDILTPNGNRFAVTLHAHGCPRRARAGGKPRTASKPAQSATISAAHFLQFLQHHRKLPTQAMSIVHAAVTHPTPEGSRAAADLAPASVQGIIRCFPYELPQMKIALHQSDPLAAGIAAQSGLSIIPVGHAASSGLVADAFGRSSQQGVISVPQMGYNPAAGTAVSNPISTTPGSAHLSGLGPVCGGMPDTPGAQSGLMVTGGLSGLGLMSAEWVLQNGSAHAVLLGRTGRMAGSAEAALVSSTARCIQAMRCDVAVSTEGQEAAAAAACGGWKLGGILHAAGLQVCSKSADRASIPRCITMTSLEAWSGIYDAA